MKTTAQGRQAESAVSEQLVRDGFKVIEQNWRTARCEIDVIAQKDKIIYFVEVKYRGADGQGGGLDYITPAKLRQMHFAADSWIAENNWDGDWQILAAAVSGTDGQLLVEEIVEVN